MQRLVKYQEQRYFQKYQEWADFWVYSVEAQAYATVIANSSAYFKKWETTQVDSL